MVKHLSYLKGQKRCLRASLSLLASLLSKINRNKTILELLETYLADSHELKLSVFCLSSIECLLKKYLEKSFEVTFELETVVLIYIVKSSFVDSVKNFHLHFFFFFIADAYSKLSSF